MPLHITSVLTQVTERFQLFFHRWLKEHKNINVFVEPRVSKELLTEDSSYNFIQTWDNGKRFNSCDALLPCAPDLAVQNIDYSRCSSFL
jgi:hypothetical protein